MKLLAFSSTVLIDYLFSINQQVVVSPNGDKPQRKMREAAASFKSDLKCGKKLDILDVFVLKLPDADSHRFHLTEGEVHWRLLLAVKL